MPAVKNVGAVCGRTARTDRWGGGRYDWMRAVLKSEHGGERYKKRKQTTQPTFGNAKHNKGVTRFHRRGRIKVRNDPSGSEG
jgi:hypothetical protein